MTRITFIIILTVVFIAPNLTRAGELSTYQSGQVDATCEQVWDLIVDFDNWAEWNPAVEYSALLEGDGQTPGSKGEFTPIIGGKKPPLKIKGQVGLSDKPSNLEYTAKLPGMDIVFGFKMKESGTGCEVTSYETIIGPGSWIFKLLFSQEGLDEEHLIWVQAIQEKL
jgi:Polyketide cyclase / dehydrase and lipid transport